MTLCWSGEGERKRGQVATRGGFDTWRFVGEDGEGNEMTWP